MNEKVLALGEKCLRLVTSNKSTSSFLGGKPLVGGQFEWPRKNDKPLGFIGQLDLKEINSEKEIDWLPQVGRLLFFIAEFIPFGIIYYWYLKPVYGI
ncbi:DUF1963 domain-containing protein [Thalassotalea litorea]|uniref:DUF1963 domain-containing protein n=1 Tax=Thalassotalea litorea TaxID=2020715 RepID=A0A5R9INJ5_9GAMM|nr:DUF1963 domain-containing protein [Thalassotalea litorea]TLU66149.1 DUF1963 domain-containing protein [Thalassotalea litorea]